MRGRECRQDAPPVKRSRELRPARSAAPDGRRRFVWSCTPSFSLAERCGMRLRRKFSKELRMHALAALALLLAQTGAGKVTGKVTLTGLAPKLAPLPVTRDMKTCGTTKPDESLEVSQGGGVKNAVLWIADGPKAAKDASKSKVTLDQKQCEYAPHV